MKIRKFRSKLLENDCFPYLVCDLFNIRYLTGFTGSSAYMLFDGERTYFISDSRYREYAESILPRGCEFILLEGNISFTLKMLLKRLGLKRLFLEEHSMTLSQFTEIRSSLRGVKIEWTEGIVNRLRMVKDSEEIEYLRKAAEIADMCYSHLLGMIKPGITEWDVAVEIEFFYRRNGCRKSSFDAIVASGSGSSMPHYETSMKKCIEHGDVLLIDMGCNYEGYNSDLTRTLFVGRVDPALETIYTIVREAQQMAVDAVCPGIDTGRLDGIARDHIARAGYGEYFGHSLGHGFGLEVHELPAVRSNGEEILRKNMTITIEPGIYVPGLGGVRIEDMVLVTARGNEILTRSSKELIVI